MHMKIPKIKLMVIMSLLAVAFTGMAAAQSGEQGDYALSESVDEFNTTSEQIALEFDNVSDEDVTVELLNDEEVVETVEDTNVDSDGLATPELDETRDVDQIAVYPADSEADAVEEVTFYYDFDGSDETDTANYNEDVTFSDFEVTDESIAMLMAVLPWLIVLAAIGMIMET